jgi:hypothetical protein
MPLPLTIFPHPRQVAAAPFTGVHVNLRSGASETITDLTARVTWQAAEPVTEADQTPSAASREQE